MWVQCGPTGMDMVSHHTKAVVFKQCLVGTKGPKQTITPSEALTIDTRQDVSMLLCLHQILTPSCSNVAEVETNHSRQYFSNLLLCNFGELVGILASVSCSRVAPTVVLYCCGH